MTQSLYLPLSLIILSLLLFDEFTNGHYFDHPKSQIKIHLIPQSHEIDSKHFVNSPQISVTPTLLKKSGDTVTISWSGISSPSSNDWIGVYSPANVDRTLIAPLKYRWANSSSTHLTTGSGNVTFNLVNGRADYSFTFFQNGWDQPTPVATSNVVEFENYNEPLQGRLSLTTNLNEMRVMWSTKDSTKPQVKWGTKSGQYDNTTNAVSVTYTVKDLCGEPATTLGWKDPGMIHTAIMGNLKNGQLYYYIFGDDAYGWSQENSFYAPMGADPSAYVRFYAYGDMGQGPSDGSIDPKWYQPAAINVTKLIVEDLKTNKDTTRLLLHIGDVSYAVGYASEWDDFGVQIEPLASQLPYQTSPGNHESDWPLTDTIYTGTDSGGECGIPFYLRFPIPSQSTYLPKTTQSSSHWYSFNHGPVHIVLMSTEHNFVAGSEQYEWIVYDLKSVDRSRTPWILFTGHRPMYVDSTWDQGNSSDSAVSDLLRQYIEPLLYKYQVDIGFWGHHHSFQQTCFVYNTSCLFGLNGIESHNASIPKSSKTPSKIIRRSTSSYIAPVHFVIGMGGAGLSQNLKPEPPEYMEYVNDQEYGYAIIEFSQSHVFQLSFVTQFDELRYQFLLFK